MSSSGSASASASAAALVSSKANAKLLVSKQMPKDEKDSKAALRAVKTNGNPQTAASGSAAASASSASSPSETPSETPSKANDENELRSPICCILGHVDTGKTKLLDKLRHTNVQDGEAGGITQQIGATYVPKENLSDFVKCDSKQTPDCKIPGLLLIDTPGHESFTNLRSRGSSLCDIAVLVVDIMHGLEPQTIESINLLRQRKTPFVVALNKIDRLYGWKKEDNRPFVPSMAAQNQGTKDEFQRRLSEIITLFAKQSLNCSLYTENKDFRKYVSLVPTSAVTGEGLSDLMHLIVQLTQTLMTKRLALKTTLQCTILEVKQMEGRGTTLDVILVNGKLREGDTIVVCGLQGPIVTTLRALLMPQAMKEMRAKTDYMPHKEVNAACGVKILAQNLEHALAGTSLFVCGPDDDVEELQDRVMEDYQTILSKVDKSGQGVHVQASTLGSLEALLQFLADSKIPVSSLGIGPIHKKDVIKASVMLERRVEYATILAFDVKVSADAAAIAATLGVRIFTADVIYHLFDNCTKYFEEVKANRRAALSKTAIFPVVLTILPEHIYRQKDPIVIGVHVKEGIAKIGTPLCIPSKNHLQIGTITGMQHDFKDVTEAKKGQEICVRIEQQNGSHVAYGRHFDQTNELVSHLTRQSIDLLKANFKDDLAEADWKLVVKLKKVFGIV